MCNKYLRPNVPGGQEVEWLYAFDIHCNAYFPLFMLLYVGQYILLPVLLMESSYFAVILSNTLYAVAFVYYFYVTFRGFVGMVFFWRFGGLLLELQYLQNTEFLLYPSILIAFGYIVSIILKFNCTQFVLHLYFGK